MPQCVMISRRGSLDSRLKYLFGIYNIFSFSGAKRDFESVGPVEFSTFRSEQCVLFNMFSTP